MDLGLEGKTAIVAGGSRGIGKAIARGLAREGVDMAIVSRTLRDLEATAAEIAGESGRKVVPLACDVAKRDDVDRMVEQAVEALGGLNILINSGSHPGGSPTAMGRIDTIVDEDFLHDFNIKYLGSLRCARAAIPHMQAAGWGRIINIGGSNARTPGNLSGGARNTTMVHFTRTLALQYGRDGITVNCIHPGTTRTETIARRLAERAAKEGITPEERERREYAPDAHLAYGLPWLSKNNSAPNAIGRMVEVSEVAAVAVFLCSEQAAATTGELVSPNGGFPDAVYY